MKVNLASILVVVFSLCAGGFSANAQTVHEKISDELLTRASVSDVIVKLKGVLPFRAEQLPREKNLKGSYVYLALQRHALLTQAPVVRLLSAQDLDHKTFRVANAIWIKDEFGSDLLYDIAAIEGVEYISANEPVAMHRVRDAEPVLRTVGVEWGISRIRADSVWSLGFTGEGVVVGGQDTGYEWDHPAISRKYRGFSGDTVDHNYNWYDAIHELSPLHNDTITNPAQTPCGVDALVPCDDHGHGTHTMGTIVGRDGEELIGVAPDAKWVGVRCMDRGYGSPMTYLEAFEWFLAPTDVNGENPDPTMAPHVINNSWRCPEMEGCNPGNFGILEEAVNNLRAAGVVVIVSAGNEGSGGCSSLADPPSIFEGTFAVGAIRQNDTIAGFSSRGPVMVDSSGRVKPDIAAPGTNVRSAWLDSAYRSLNGTSMAGPHVAGVVALMISANPELAGQVEVIENILRETARPKGPVYECADDSMEIPNNTYGYGIVDALAAVERALQVTSSREVQPGPGEIVVFPNPSAGSVNYVVPGSIGDRFNLSVFDTRGTLVKSLVDQPAAGSFSLANSANGIYTVVMIDQYSGTTHAAKVVVSR